MNDHKNQLSNHPDLIIYASEAGPRFRYITELILGDLLGLSFRITTDIEDYKNSTLPRICYNSRSLSDSECLIVPAGLLNERGVNPHQINVIENAGIKALFPVYTRDTCLTYDIFSAAFYMVSRYEEYLPFIRDEHGRFNATSSLAAQKGFLQMPVVNLWSRELGAVLVAKYPSLNLKFPEYQFVPTLDIDAAWAFRHKGFYRSLGGFLKDFKTLDYDSIRRRYRSLFKLETDPFDTYDFMHDVHHKYGLRPIYFILFAEYNEYDKNTPVNNMPFRQLIKSLADEGDIGIHPSYASNSNESLFEQEINGLSQVIHREVTSSRQHFLKLKFPDTYRTLLAYDITDDYTMGFAGMPGFRAGICTTFKWYDLEMERPTKLRVHPFAIMDGTLRDYMKVEAEGAMLHIRPLVRIVKLVGGTFIPLFHNETLSEWRRWKGWRRVYEEMLSEGAELG